jgi:hypothetical protein
MIRVDIGETFPVTVALWDEDIGANASGQTVYYDIRDMSDAELSPPINGILTESTTTSGIYKTSATINTAGRYVYYATCSGFFDSSEEIIVNPENIYSLVKQNRQYNISVEDVLRTNSTPTASQTVRNVSLNNTDYISTYVKWDDDTTWSGSTISGTTWAWYRTIVDEIPYKMGSEY